jgi:hypothetical protein
MRRIRMVVLAAVSLVTSVTAAHAQGGTPWLFFGAGGSFPSGNYGDYAKTGWLASGGIGYTLPSKVFFGGEFSYGSNSHSDFAGDKTNLIGAQGFLGYDFGATDAKVQPFVVAGAGMLNHQFRSDQFPDDNTSEWKFAWSGGAGFQYLASAKTGIYVLGRYWARESTKFISLQAGLTIGLGGGQ